MGHPPIVTSLGPTSVVEAVAAALRQQLLGGNHRPGEVLRDTELVDEFGVARPTVRAAIQLLVTDGLLVRDRSRSARLPSFRHDEVRDLYVARRAVEFAAVEQITVRKPSLQPLAEISEHLSHISAHATWQQVADLDVEFHRRLVAAAGSTRLSRLFEGLANESRLLIAFQRPAYDSIATLAHEHPPILEALRARRHAQCRRLLDVHYTDAIEALSPSAATTTTTTT